MYVTQGRLCLLNIDIYEKIASEIERTSNAFVKSPLPNWVPYRILVGKSQKGKKISSQISEVKYSAITV